MITSSLVAIGFAFNVVIARKPPPESLITANGVYRPIEVRLSGFGFELLLPTGHFRTALVASRGSQRMQHEAGVTRLLMGRTDEAVATLEKATLLVEDDVDLLNDLAAAYLVRDGTHQGSDAFRAVEVTERAWRLRQTPEIAWNRALALEKIHLRATALTAWIDFLDVESDRKWRAEADAHVRRLSTPSQSRRWSLWREEAAKPATHDAAARTFSQELRMYGEEEVLTAWAAATLSQDKTAATRLHEADRIGAALKESGGDALLIETVDAIHRASGDRDRLRRLAAAHVLYREGRTSYARQEMLRAVDQLDAAEKQLAEEQSPFSFRAALYAATTEYYAARHDAALARLERLRGTIDPAATRYPSLVGQIHWVIGLVELSRGHRNEALSAFTTALKAFERSRETESRASVESLLAETYRSIGQTDIAWSYQRRALAGLEVLGRTRRSHAILTEAAIVAAAQSAPLTALHFQQNVVTIAQLSRDPVSIADALTGRSVYAAAAGERRLAESDLAQAARVVRGIADPIMRGRCLANLLAAEATVTRTFDPRRAARAIEYAIARMERLDHRIRLVQLHLEAGRAFDQTARPAEALRQWRSGIAECERQRARLEGENYRRTYFDTCRSLFEDAMRTLTRDRRFGEALDFAEKSRARGLFDALSRRTSSEKPVLLPRQVTVVEYAVLPDRLVTWIVNGDRIHATARMVDRAALRGEIDRLESTRSNDAAFRASAARLHDLLLGGIEARLSPRVIFIPDDSLYRVPFGALLDRRTNRFLIERHQVSVAPSMALLTLREPPQSSPQEAVLIDAGSVRNRYSPESVRLPGTTREIARLRMLYPRAKVLEGTECTTKNVTKAMQSGVLVHFAGHAVDGRGTTDPALVLSASSTDQGLLYPREISRLPLTRARLVVLGACGTADGRIGSEGPLSISRAFLSAGAHRVIATLWEIEDESSSHLLVSFHESLGRDASPEHALRAIQIQAIRNSIPASEWAAFEVLHTTL